MPTKKPRWKREGKPAPYGVHKTTITDAYRPGTTPNLLAVPRTEKRFATAAYGNTGRGGGGDTDIVHIPTGQVLARCDGGQLATGKAAQEIYATVIPPWPEGWKSADLTLYRLHGDVLNRGVMEVLRKHGLIQETPRPTHAAPEKPKGTTTAPKAGICAWCGERYVAKLSGTDIDTGTCSAECEAYLAEAT